MLTARDVQEVLFSFAQRCFARQGSPCQPIYAEQERMFELLADGELTVLDVHNSGQINHELLRDLFSQYILFLQVNASLKFPVNFLNGSDETHLGRPLLDYICHYRWPFPKLQK